MVTMGSTLVLVADDNEGHRTLVDMLLAPEGYELAMVQDGKEALDWLRDHTPALVILDVAMPNLGGLEVAERIRRVGRLKDVKIVILTALRDVQTRERARLASVEALVNKPLEGKDFRSLIKRVLAGEPQPF